MTFLPFEASFPTDTATVTVLPWCFSCMSFVFILVVSPLGGYFEVRGKRMGNSQSSHVGSSAHRRISLSSPVLLLACPFQRGIIPSSHLSLLFLDALVGLIALFCFSLCMFLDLSLNWCCPFLDSHSPHCILLMAALQLWSGQRGWRDGSH